PKLVQEKITGINKKTGCCTYNVSHNKCWRHFLKAANTLNLDDSGKASQWVYYTRYRMLLGFSVGQMAIAILEPCCKEFSILITYLRKILCLTIYTLKTS
ncbi:hypothetical protein CFOL_v3_09433, partial [Cephalotus follicularis]